MAGDSPTRARTIALFWNCVTQNTVQHSLRSEHLLRFIRCQYPPILGEKQATFRAHAEIAIDGDTCLLNNGWWCVISAPRLASPSPPFSNTVTSNPRRNRDSPAMRPAIEAPTMAILARVLCILRDSSRIDDRVHSDFLSSSAASVRRPSDLYLGEEIEFDGQSVRVIHK